jgi:hypothetical protein
LEYLDGISGHPPFIRKNTWTPTIHHVFQSISEEKIKDNGCPGSFLRNNPKIMGVQDLFQDLWA